MQRTDTHGPTPPRGWETVGIDTSRGSRIIVNRLKSAHELHGGYILAGVGNC